MTVRRRLALTILLTGLLTAAGVVVTVALSFQRFEQAVQEVFDLRPGAIVRDLDLKKPGYKRSAAYGHFGRSGFTWETLSRLDDFKAAVGA